jgi:Ring finger domain/B-box zinc finger
MKYTLASMEEFFVCPVCLERFDEGHRLPLILACGHSFCKDCIQNMYKQSLSCPFDRKIENRRLVDLPKNLLILQIISHKNDKKSYKCFQHDTKKVKYYCYQCRTGFCTTCLRYHTPHSLVELDSTHIITYNIKLKSNELTTNIDKANNQAKIYEEKLRKCKDSRDKAILEIKNKFNSLRDLLSLKENEIIFKFTEGLKKIEDLYDCKFADCMNFFEEKANDLIKLQALAAGIEFADFETKVNKLKKIDDLLDSRASTELLPVEEIMDEIICEINGINTLKKQILKLHVESQPNYGIGNRNPYKKKKTDET